jgi:hypothetical protein
LRDPIWRVRLGLCGEFRVILNATDVEKTSAPTRMSGSPAVWQYIRYGSHGGAGDNREAANCALSKMGKEMMTANLPKHIASAWTKPVEGDNLVVRVYDELRGVAPRVVRRERIDQTLSPTAVGDDL